MSRRLATAVTLVLALAALSGCLRRTGMIPRPVDHVAPKPCVGISPGDEVEVRFFLTPELNVTQKVRRDGRISLQLIGDVAVEHRSPDELRQALEALYEPHLKHPNITVLVTSSENHHIYVGGEVNDPGRIEIPGTMTALEAVMLAGGFDYVSAEDRNVVIIRHRGDKRIGYSLDLRPSIEGEETQPFYLAPRDIVFVPRTTIYRVDQWIDQYISQIVPKTGFSYSTTSGGTTTGIDTGVR